MVHLHTLGISWSTHKKYMYIRDLLEYSQCKYINQGPPGGPTVHSFHYGNPYRQYMQYIYIITDLLDYIQYSKCTHQGPPELEIKDNHETPSDSEFH